MNEIKNRLESAIVTEGLRTGLWNKIDFWQPNAVTNPDIKTPRTTDRLDDVLKLVDPQEFPQDPELLSLTGIAWEFIWGQPSPPEISTARQKLLAKHQSGKPLSPIETHWLTIISVDTDEF